MSEASATERASQWISKFGAALEAGGHRRAPSACSARIAIGATWCPSPGISRHWRVPARSATCWRRTLASVRAKQVSQSSVRRAGWGGAIEAWFTFETDVARGRGLVRLKGRQSLDSLDPPMAELKGYEERTGRSREPGVLHGQFPGRKYYIDLKTEEEALGASRQPYCVIIGGGQGGIALGARMRRLGVPTIIVEKKRAARRFLAQALQIALPARSGLVRPHALRAVSRALAGLFAQG